MSEIRAGAFDTPPGRADYPGPTDERSIVGAFGFWTYLRSDGIYSPRSLLHTPRCATPLSAACRSRKSTI